MARRISFVLAGLLAVYLGYTVWQSVIFLESSSIVAKGLGLAVLLFAILGAGLALRELRFGGQVARLTSQMPSERLPQVGSRVSIEQSAEFFATAKAIIEGQPLSSNWQDWYALAVAYDLTGDRAQARKAMQHAIALEAKTRP